MDRRRLDAALASLMAAGLVVRAAKPLPTSTADRAGADVVIPFGLPPLDAALPGGGLARAGLHEFAAAPGDPAPRALAAVMAARGQGPVLWVRLLRDAQERGLPYPYGLLDFGLDPDRLLLVAAAKPQEALWAMEEGLRAGCLGAVVGDGVAPDLTQGRRLQLAAEGGRGPALAILPSEPERQVRAGRATAATTRWQLASLASSEEAGGPGRSRWSLILQRCRGGRAPLAWTVEWDRERGLVEPAPAERAPVKAVSQPLSGERLSRTG